MTARFSRHAALVATIALLACNPFPDLDALQGGSAEAGAAPSFCGSSVHDFCADFDDARPLSAVWEVTGAWQLTESPVQTQPRAVRGALPVAQSGKPQIVLKTSIEHEWTSTVLELDMNLVRPEWPTDGGPVFLGQIEFPPDIQFFLWFTRDDVFGVTAQPPYAPQTSTQKVTYGTWTHLRFTVDPRPPGSYELVVNHAASPALAQTNLGMTASPAHTVRLSVALEQWNPPAPAVDVTYDDITLDFR